MTAGIRPATTEQLGGVIVGETLKVENGKINLSDSNLSKINDTATDVENIKQTIPEKASPTNQLATTEDLQKIEVATDDVTINKSAGKIQAIGALEKNIGAVKYDWVGTLEEYEAQDVANKHPDWICYITDDFTGKPTDLGAISEQLNKKADIGYFVVPDYARGVELAVNATHTIPENGFLLIRCNENATTANVSINGKTFGISYIYKSSGDVEGGSLSTLPVAKGDVFSSSVRGGWIMFCPVRYV